MRRHDPQGKTIVPGSAARRRRTFASAHSAADRRSPDTMAGRPQHAASRKTATDFPDALTVS